MKYPAQAESEGCQPTDQSMTITIVPNSNPAPIRERGMATGTVSNKANPRVQNDDPTRNQTSSRWPKEGLCSEVGLASRSLDCSITPISTQAAKECVV